MRIIGVRLTDSDDLSDFDEDHGSKGMMCYNNIDAEDEIIEYIVYQIFEF
jgi:hypothetical protein